MAFLISEDKISEIANTANILEIISDVVALKKAGKEYLGLCPFHSEKTPSFSVNPDKQVFYCHGCHEGGNVFSFLMKQNGISFPEAAEMVARRYGIEIDQNNLTSQQRKRFSERESLLSINKEAVYFFKNFLLNNPKGKKALNYIKNRNISNETINNFNLGYTPSGWDNLVNHFSNKKIPLSLVQKSGLIVSKKNNSGFYDRFRDRIMFPIYDVNLQAIGFGGRVLDDSLPKYLNSPETPLYNKSRCLYGLNRAKNACRKSNTVYIVEGYFDLIALHQHGIINSVATLGTALTSKQVRILKGFIGKTGRIVLVFDSDTAGIKAAKRSIEVFDKEYADAKILILPQGHDPDSYLFEFGGNSFIVAAEKASSVMTFLTDYAVQKHGLSTAGKIKIVSEITGYLASVNDKVLRSLYIKEFSERIGIDESAVLGKIRDFVKNNTSPHRSYSEPYQIDTKDFSNKGHKKGYGLYNNKETRSERHIIAMMLQFPELLPEIRKKNVLDYFKDDSLKSIGQKILEHVNGNCVQIPKLISLADDDEQKNIIASLAVCDENWNVKGFSRFITRFVEAKENGDKKTLYNKIKAAEEKNDEELLLKSLNEANLRLKILKDKQKRNKSIRNNYYKTSDK